MLSLHSWWRWKKITNIHLMYASASPCRSPCVDKMQVLVISCETSCICSWWSALGLIHGQGSKNDSRIRKSKPELVCIWISLWDTVMDKKSFPGSNMRSMAWVGDTSRREKWRWQEKFLGGGEHPIGHIWPRRLVGPTAVVQARSQLLSLDWVASLGLLRLRPAKLQVLILSSPIVGHCLGSGEGNLFTPFVPQPVPMLNIAQASQLA